MAIGEIYGGITAFKAMFDMAKALKDIDNSTSRNAAVIALQEQIFAAQSAQANLIELVRSLEAKVAAFEKWDTEKQRYELKELGHGSAFVYMLKPDARGSEPPHWVCTNCYSHRLISVIQFTAGPQRRSVYLCPSCKGEVFPASENFVGSKLKWLD